MPAYSLLRSSALVLDVAEELLPLVDAWIPLNAELSIPSSRVTELRVVGFPDGDRLLGASRGGFGEETASTLLTLGSVTASVPEGDTMALCGQYSAYGAIDLGSSRAVIELPGDSEFARTDAYSMLTLAAAFLLGRMHHALMHAGAVVDTDGRAWLLVGDSHAGKTSTVVALVEAGWCYLADDQVVISRTESGEILVEGWPRVAHLDEGWSTRTVTGTRAAVDLRTLYGSRLLRAAPLGGVILPRVEASATTSAQAAHPAAVFSALVRQSPWLMADKVASRGVARLLTAIAATRAFTLILGADSYGRGNVIARCLEQHDPPASAPRDP